MVVRQFVLMRVDRGEHLLTLGLLGDGHGQTAGVRVVWQRVLQATRGDRVGSLHGCTPLLLLLGCRGCCG